MEYGERVRIAKEKFRDEFGRDSGGVVAVDAADLEKYEHPKPQDGDTWGNWTFQQSDLTLQFRDGHFDYEIDLERITNRVELLHWFGHLMVKVWGTPENIGNLVRALYDLTASSAGEWYAEFSTADIVRQRFAR